MKMKKAFRVFIISFTIAALPGFIFGFVFAKYLGGYPDPNNFMSGLTVALVIGLTIAIITTVFYLMRGLAVALVIGLAVAIIAAVFFFKSGSPLALVIGLTVAIIATVFYFIPRT